MKKKKKKIDALTHSTARIQQHHLGMLVQYLSSHQLLISVLFFAADDNIISLLTLNWFAWENGREFRKLVYNHTKERTKHSDKKISNHHAP